MHLHGVCLSENGFTLQEAEITAPALVKIMKARESHQDAADHDSSANVSGHSCEMGEDCQVEK